MPAALLFMSSIVSAQPLTTRLGTLLTQQTADPVFAPNLEAASITRDTITGIVAVELSTTPVASSASGFVYRVNPDLGVVQRASSSFGPFYTETVLRNGRRQSGIGIRYQHYGFNSLQGGDLTTGNFPTNATRVAGSTLPFAVDTLQLSLDAQIVSLVGSYGVTDRLSIGGNLPIQTVSFSGRRSRLLNGTSTVQSVQSGSSTGLGDASLQGRYRLTGQSTNGLSVGSDLRLPTGRREDLLGAGRAAARMFLLSSFEDGKLAVHANGGLGVGGQSREYFVSMATTFAAIDRVTVVGEILARHLSDLTRVQDVYQPDPQAPTLETMRWLAVEEGLTTTSVVLGAKWNLAGNWLINSNILIRLNDSGLRARVTPTISLDFDFQR